ncbi:replication factor-A protein 1 [Clavulina sp. PMI_390]|nr:replication factor-A protein 1 [Clavulina sp. PMI_390]
MMDEPATPSPLTPNALQFMQQAEPDEVAGVCPRVQVISVKTLAAASEGAQPRHRLIISDGESYSHAMLNTQLNYLVDNETIRRWVTFKITIVANNWVGTKKLLVILKIDEDSFEQAPKFGDPKPMEVKEEGVDSVSTTPAPNPPVSTSRGPTTTAAPVAAPRASNGGERPPNVLPIEGLSPYQNKWTIQARCTQKSDIKNWSNAKGDGKLFSCTFMDNTGEIKATAFNAAADELFDKIREGSVYYVSRARVNVAKKKFSNLSNEYEITLEKTSEVVECMDTVDAPQIRYNFVGLDQMENLQKDQTCDVLGVVHEVGPLGEITSKTTNKKVSKRDILLVDRSEASIRLTFWGKQAETFNEDSSHPVIAFKGVRVGDYGGRTLSMSAGSTMTADPDLESAHLLRGWYDSQGSNTLFRAQSGGGGVMGGAGGGGGGGGGFRRDEVKPLQVVQETLLGMGDKPDYFNSKVRVVHVKNENMSYTSCPGEGCQKKVIEQDDGSWRCEKCNKSYPNCEYRYLLSISCADYSGQIWLQAFNDVGEMMLGITARELHELFETDRDAFSAKIRDALGKQWNLSCRVKQETYNDVTRARYGINRAFPVNFGEESRLLLSELQKYPATAPA